MSKPLTTEEFIKRAKKVHDNKYTYDKVEYVDSQTKVCIICPKHGEFWQAPFNHLYGYGCKLCANKNAGLYHKFNCEIFIEKAKKIHNNKYDYSKVNYINAKTKVCIICPIHGEFWQTPDKHLRGQGCSICHHQNIGQQKRITYEEFLEKAKNIHGNKYSYKDYIKISEKVTITCPMHGEFKQLASLHLNGAQCPKCANIQRAIKQRFTTEEFIKLAKNIHDNKYTYDKVEYIDSQTKVCIICPIHGEFWQTPKGHLSGCGCSKCNLGVASNIGEFKEKAKKIHGNFYSYDKSIYINNIKKIEIKCNKCGYIFYQSPSKHLSGCGCPKCKISHIEENVFNFLEQNNINFIWQCNSQKFKWLQKLKIDFYLPEYNVAIECQGEQHFKPFSRFGGEKAFEVQQERDKRKKDLCIKNKVKLLYFSNIKNMGDDIITNLNDLLVEIKKTH